MPIDQPTVDEVRELLELTENGGLDVLPYHDRLIAALCRHFLAQAAAPQMSAGEFAGLVVANADSEMAKCSKRRDAAKACADDKQVFYYEGARIAIEAIIDQINLLACGRNVEIVEPK